tara:strand:- start:2142 stop:2792 length:651 start_codon:yes stop_codon:yes gene_type:complete
MKRKNIIIIGAGNTASEIYPILQSLSKTKKFNIQAILDDNKKYHKKKFQGVPIHIGIENAVKYKNSLFVFGIGSYQNKNKRKKIFDKMSVDLDRFPNIIDTSTKIEDNVRLGYGNIIYPYSVICSGTKIKNFCIFTHHNILAHDVIINSFSTFGSKTSILNNTRIGKEVFVGANVLIGENISVDDFSTVVMGSVVLTNIKKRQVVFGNPAKVIKNG